MYDLELFRNFRNSLILSCISSIPHVYEGSQAPQFKEQLDLSFLLQHSRIDRIRKVESETGGGILGLIGRASCILCEKVAL